VNDGGAERLESGSVDGSGENQATFEESAPHHEPAHEDIGVGINAPIVTPNAPSAPVWSLAAQHAPEHATTPPDKKIEVPSQPAQTMDDAAIVEAAPIASRETVAAETAAPQTPEQSAKKGWWQRPFRLRD
jgi:hypothetical protein